MRSFINYFALVHRYRYTIWIMARQELRSRYAGSVLGGVWSLIHPVVMVFIYWLVFSVGFKVSPAKQVPFLSWFLCAFVAWQTLNESILQSSGSLTRNKNLIKKTIFPSQILPLISIFASFINSLALFFLMFLVFYLQGIKIGFLSFQVLYYFLCLFVMCLGLGWLFSAASIVLKDLTQVIHVGLQFLFWSTPIFYQLDFFPEKYQVFFYINPVFYLTEGFRNSFLYDIPFWNNPYQTLYFWGFALTCFVFGGWFFKTIKRELADVI